MPNARDFFTDSQIDRLKASIAEAEMLTNGEIRIHLEGRTDGMPVLERAAAVFGELEMEKTEARTGVLFYLAVEDRTFAILGDTGIDAATPDDFWEEIKNAMRRHFVKGEFCEGLQEGIMMAGQALQAHFPKLPGNQNELSNEISFRESEKD